MLRYKVVSDSMTPLIPVGAELLIKKIENGYKLKKFDILLFKIDDKLICHFFWHQNIHYDAGMIITRNLKEGSYDIPFRFDKIVGLVTNYQIGIILKVKIFLRDKFVRIS